MEEEVTVVNQMEAETNPVTEEYNEQVEEQVEASSQPTDGYVKKEVYEKVREAMKAERAKRKELEAQTSKPASQVTESEDETVKRFLETEARAKKAEANYEIVMKMQTDPSFKERADIVSDYIEQGYTFAVADQLAKGKIMDTIMSAPQEQTPTPKPKQITTQAIPEHQEQPASTGNAFKDMLNDPNMPEAAKEAIRRNYASMM